MGDVRFKLSNVPFDKWVLKLNALLVNSWWVFSFAFLVRVIVVLQGYDGGPQDTPEYEEIAFNLLQGRGFVVSEWWYGFEVWSWRAPFYPFFLAGVYGVFGQEQWIVRLIQCVAGALTAVFLVKIAKKLDMQHAVWCGGLAILYGPLVSVSNEVMTETWFVLFLVLAIYCLISEPRFWGLGGFWMGCAILTRPVGALLCVAWGIYALQKRIAFRHILMVGAVVFVVVLPWTLRNYDIHHDWPILSTQGGFIVARSNALIPDWKKDIGWDVSREFLEKMPSELARDRYWWREGFSFIKSNPVAYLKLVLERFLRLWYFFRPDYNFWWMLMWPFAGVGIWYCGRREGYGLMTLFTAISVVVFSCLLYGSTRFRLPLEAFGLVFCGAGLTYLRARWQVKKFMGIFLGWVLIQGVIDWQDIWFREALLGFLKDLSMK